MKLITFDGKPYYTATVIELNWGRLERRERKTVQWLKVASVYLATFGTVTAVLFT